MMKKAVSILLVLCLVLSGGFSAFAHTKEEIGGHDEIMSNILFGSATYKEGLKKDSKKYIALAELENAVALCLDQYNNYYADELRLLNDQGIHGLPKTIGEIDFSGNQHHRYYTHRGWNYTYQDDKAHWETRKTILLQTVNHVFGFQTLAGKWLVDHGYDKQCDAFAAFLYYIHVLGDYDSEYGETYTDLICIALGNPQTDSPDIYWELEKYLPIIFDEESRQKFESSYNGLMQDIKMQASEARKFVRNTPDIKANYDQYQHYARKLLEKLEIKIPSLLKQTEFFKVIFYD